jgi:hypothetical protein
MTLEEQYEKWRRSPEGNIHADGRPVIFTVEEWDQFKKLREEKLRIEAERKKTHEPETRKRQERKKA